MTRAANDRPVLETKGITKVFPGVRALGGVDFELHRGEVLAVVGENGAGKSTLMKILGGVHAPTSGEIVIDGEVTQITTVQRATELGIAFVHQELNLSDNLDVAANVFLGREPRAKRLAGFVDRKRLYADAKGILDRIGVRCDPRATVRDLSIGTQQMVEIAKAISVDARIIIMDEPTSSLSQGETVRLFSVIKQLRSEGVSVIYISHRLGEVKELANRVTVLRDGRISGRLSHGEIEAEAMIRLMVGRDTEKFYHHSHEPSGETALEFKGFVTKRYPRESVDLAVRKGETVVVAGLVGAGRTELAHAAFGIDDRIRGDVLINGNGVDIDNPRDAIRAGIGYVPEDRKRNGLILEMTVEENITLAGLTSYQRFSMMDFDRLTVTAESMVKRLSIRAHGVSQIVETLSGGNQQKVVLSKWLSLDPTALILDEPTRGIDVVAKEEVYRLMEKLASAGVAMLVISSEMQEVLGIADRIVVMHEGRVAGELLPHQFSEEAVVTLATGGQ